MKVMIEMLNDDGLATESHSAHVCNGDPEECPQGAAICETCGKVATKTNPVYVWTSATGLEYFVCQEDLESDSYARVLRADLAQPLETGDVVAVLTHTGEVGYFGEVQSLPAMGGRIGIFNPETDEVHYVAQADGEGYRRATEEESDAYIERWVDSE